MMALPAPYQARRLAAAFAATMMLAVVPASATPATLASVLKACANPALTPAAMHQRLAAGGWTAVTDAKARDMFEFEAFFLGNSATVSLKERRRIAAWARQLARDTDLGGRLMQGPDGTRLLIPDRPGVRGCIIVAPAAAFDTLRAAFPDAERSAGTGFERLTSANGATRLMAERASEDAEIATLLPDGARLTATIVTHLPNAGEAQP